ncbi:unnamed protein product, partial [Darwinula stevensoni]
MESACATPATRAKCAMTSVPNIALETNAKRSAPARTAANVTTSQSFRRGSTYLNDKGIRRRMQLLGWLERSAVRGALPGRNFRLRLSSELQLRRAVQRDGWGMRVPSWVDGAELPG